MGNTFLIPPRGIVLEQHIPQNDYDHTGFKTGDIVVSFLDPGQVGVLNKESKDVPGLDKPWELLKVTWENGHTDSYYPSQLLKITIPD